MNKSMKSLFAMAAVALLLGACGQTERNTAPPVMPHADGEVPAKLPKGPLAPKIDPKLNPKKADPAPKTIPPAKD